MARSARPPFRWDDLQHFLELARKRTLARAARRLGVAHTTVLRRVADLERALDRKLFARSAQGFTLTQAGAELLQHAQAVERAAEQAATPAPTPTDALSGSVRIAAVEGLATLVLIPALAEFRTRHPNIAVELVTHLETANLTRREADLSIGFVRPTGPRLVAQRVARCDVHLYAAASYLGRHGEPRRLAELERHLFVDYIDDLIEIPALTWLSDTIGPRQAALRSTSPLAQLAAVRAGFGIGMFPDYMVQGAPELRQVLPDDVCTEREFWLAIHEELRPVPRMKAVHAFLKDLLRRHPALQR